MAKGGRCQSRLRKGGARDAQRRNHTGNHSQQRYTGTARERPLPPTLEPEPVPDGLRAHRQERRRAHPRRNTGDRRRDEDGRHPRDHRGPPLRALPMDSGPPRIHPESQREAAATRTPRVVGQAAARSDASPIGGVLRTAVQRPVARLPAQPWMPHGLHGDNPHLDGHNMVHRRRYRRLLRQHRP